MSLNEQKIDYSAPEIWGCDSSDIDSAPFIIHEATDAFALGHSDVVVTYDIDEALCAISDCLCLIDDMNLKHGTDVYFDLYNLILEDFKVLEPLLSESRVERFYAFYQSCLTGIKF